MDLVTSDLFNAESMKNLFSVCTSLAKTPFLRTDLRQKPEAVLSIILMARELNIPPMMALTKMHFIQGAPTLPVTLMLGLVRQKFKDARFEFKVDHKNQTVECTGYRDSSDKTGFTSYWDMARAKQLGLIAKDNYQKQPVTMLRHRATSEVISVLWPDVLYGVHATEEFQDFEGKEIEVKPVSDIDADFPIPPEDKAAGPNYLIQNAKFRGKRLKEIDPDELSDYAETIRARGATKEWEIELLDRVDDYLDNFKQYTGNKPSLIEVPNAN